MGVFSTRLSLDFIVGCFALRGFTLVSAKYAGNKCPLRYVCPCGHIGVTSWNRFSRGSGCPECFGKRALTLQEVVAYMGSFGYTVTSDAIVSGNSQVSFVCPRGHVGRIRFHDFKHSGNRCLLCRGITRHTAESVSRLFLREGYQLLSTEYKNNLVPLKYVCPVGHEGTVTLANFTSGARCAECAGKAKRRIGDIRAAFLTAGYVLVSTEYVNNHTPLEALCGRGHRVLVQWNHFQQGVRCPVCSRGNISPISQEWLDSLSVPKENREVWITCGDKKYRVDAFDPQTNTIFEFLGDYWHGNPNVHDMCVVNGHTKKTFGRHFDETVERLRFFRAAGYNLNIIWESDFLAPGR